MDGRIQLERVLASCVRRTLQVMKPGSITKVKQTIRMTITLVGHRGTDPYPRRFREAGEQFIGQAVSLQAVPPRFPFIGIRPVGQYRDGILFKAGQCLSSQISRLPYSASSQSVNDLKIFRQERILELPLDYDFGAYYVIYKTRARYEGSDPCGTGQARSQGILNRASCRIVPPRFPVV